jgi:hypothetical protein
MTVGPGGVPDRAAADVAKADGTYYDVLAVAAAMLHLTLPHVGSGLCIQVSSTSNGISLRATYKVGGTPEWPRNYSQQMSADFTVIDTIATHWGHRGNEHTQTLWAVLP